MSNVPSEKGYVQQESIFTREATSESLFTEISGSTNFAMDTLGTNHSFKLNGVYSLGVGKETLDGPLIFDWDAEIFEVQVYSHFGGTVGTSEIDLLYSTDRGATFNTIFTTNPQIMSTAASPTYVGIGDTVTGCTAPVLITTPFQVVAGSVLALKLVSAMTGATDLYVTVKYRPRS